MSYDHEISKTITPTTSYRDGRTYRVYIPDELLSVPDFHMVGVIVEESSLLATNTIPGKEGGEVIYMGSEPMKITIIYRGKQAQGLGTLYSRLKQFVQGKTYKLTINAHGQTWQSVMYVQIDEKRQDLTSGFSGSDGPWIFLSLDLVEEDWRDANIYTSYKQDILDDDVKKTASITTVYTEAIV